MYGIFLEFKAIFIHLRTRIIEKIAKMVVRIEDLVCEKSQSNRYVQPRSIHAAVTNQLNLRLAECLNRKAHILANHRIDSHFCRRYPIYGHQVLTADNGMRQVGTHICKDAKRAVVILRLHGRTQIRSTFIIVLERYAQKLQANGGKLILSGVSEKVKEQLDKTETTETIPEEDIFMATNKLGASTKAAIEAAEAWLAEDISTVQDNKEMEI